MIDFSQTVLFDIGRLQRAMVRAINRELSPLGLGSGRYIYLVYLYVDDGASQQQLADRMYTDKAAVARAIARLERDGYVCRSADAQDRRQQRVYLTDKARQLRPQLEQLARCLYQKLVDGVPAAQRETTAAALKIYAGNISKVYVADPD